MSEDTNETEAEAVAEPKRKRLYYTNPEVKTKLVDILRTNKIAYLSVGVTTKAIEVIQGGDHESAGVISSLFTLPGVFGFDEDHENIESAPEVQVVQDVDQFDVITRTILRLSRANAEPMYADDGINDDDEGTHESPEEGSGTSDEITREDVASYTEDEVDDVLTGHGVNPEDFEDLEAKRAAVEKIVFID